MPEGPELRLASNLVNKVCSERTFAGQPIKSSVSKCAEVDFRSPRYAISSQSRGKEVALVLQCREDPSNRVRILFRFGMSGQFAFTTAGDAPKHSHLKFLSSSSSSSKEVGPSGGGHSPAPAMVLSFVDPRRFGSWHVVAEGWGKGRGPDPMLEHAAFRQNVLSNLEDPAFGKPICEVMLNQSYFNGIGNYLRAEVLFRAGRIPPFSRARDVLRGQLGSGPPRTTEMDATADVLQLCHDVPLEVVNLREGKSYSETGLEAKKEGGKSVSAFERWLQCYYNPSMRNVVDHNGRTIWFSGEAGPLAPKNVKSRGKVHPAGRSKKAITVKTEPLEGERGASVDKEEEEKGKLTNIKRSKGKSRASNSKANSDSRVKTEANTATGAKVKTEKTDSFPPTQENDRLGKRSSSKSARVPLSAKRLKDEEALLVSLTNGGHRRSLRLAVASSKA